MTQTTDVAYVWTYWKKGEDKPLPLHYCPACVKGDGSLVADLTLGSQCSREICRGCGLEPACASNPRAFHAERIAGNRRDGMVKRALEQSIHKRKYQQNYYKTVTKKKRRGEHRWRDPEYRRKERDRDQRRRSLVRADSGPARFRAQVEAARSEERPTKDPRVIKIKRKTITVYSAGDLAREVGREARTVRRWLNEGVLPGASAFFGQKRPRAYFSKAFCEAVYKACLTTSKVDGWFRSSKLKHYIIDEMKRRKVSYVPLGSSNEDRVYL